MKIPVFIQDAAERAGKSFVQGFAVGGGLMALGSEAVANVQIVGFPWEAALSTGGGMALASVITSVLSFKLGSSGTASATTAVEPATGRHASDA